MCPNCRQDADLEAPVDVETETWEAILRTPGPLSPSADPGATREPQVNMLNFLPIPDISPHLEGQRETHLAHSLQGLTLGKSDEINRNTPLTPDRDLSLSRTLSPSLAPIIENDIPSRAAQDPPGFATPPIGISRRVRALSATRDGFEDLAGLSATPTIDRGPFVYGDMTVNADGSAEATTSNGNVVQLPRESISDEADARATKAC